MLEEYKTSGNNAVTETMLYILPR